MSNPAPFETFPALASLSAIQHAFTQRAPGLDVKVERDRALELLGGAHASICSHLGLDARRFIVAQQVHGINVVAVDSHTVPPVPAADGLISDSPGVCLGIYVADCCAVYLVDPVRRAIGLLHSGKIGSGLGISTVAIEKMVSEYGCEPHRMIAQLSPCIRPPEYEIDFTAQIVAQCRAAGIRQVIDCGICTAAHVDRYYSYRVDLGKTGRMLALLAIQE